MRTSSLRILMIGLTSVAAGAMPLVAQTTSVTPTAIPQPTEAQMAALQARTRKMQHPAEWVLELKQDLNLREDQIVTLQKLVLSLRDSEPARQQRMIAGFTAGGPNSPVLAMGKALQSWSGTVDEAAIRAAACEQSKMQAEITLNMIRDRHAVGDLLTEAQQVALRKAEMQPFMPGATKP
jgi:hypothetical protein